MIRTHYSKKTAMTLSEVMVVLIILGIALFITLPRLSHSKRSTELSAAKAKATMLNQAKDSFIAARGINKATADWKNAGSKEARYNLIKGLIPTNSAATLADYAVKGYLYTFNADLVAADTMLYEDINLNGSIDSDEPQIGY